MLKNSAHACSRPVPIRLLKMSKAIRSCRFHFGRGISAPSSAPRMPGHPAALDATPDQPSRRPPGENAPGGCGGFQMVPAVPTGSPGPAPLKILQLPGYELVVDSLGQQCWRQQSLADQEIVEGLPIELRPQGDLRGRAKRHGSFSSGSRRNRDVALARAAKHVPVELFLGEGLGEADVLGHDIVGPLGRHEAKVEHRVHVEGSEARVRMGAAGA